MHTLPPDFEHLDSASDHMLIACVFGIINIVKDLRELPREIEILRTEIENLLPEDYDFANSDTDERWLPAQLREKISTILKSLTHK